MLNVAMLSKWHVHAEGYANYLLELGNVNITAVWDDDAERGSAWAKSLGADYEPDLDKLLARTDVDAVVCDAPTTDHQDVMVKAALAGKHIFTEKAMAPTVAECEKIAEAVRKTGVNFVISMPMRITPVIQLAKKMIDNGEFGKISLIRIRNGHNGVSGNWLPDYWYDGSKTAGGSLMDLGCHPMYTAPYLLGTPKRVSALLTELYNTGLDEAACATVEFENGAVAVCETSFVTYNTPGAIEIYGTEATLLAYGSDVKLISNKLDKETISGYVTPKLPEALPMPLKMFVEACINKTPVPAGFGLEDGIVLTKLLENAYVSNSQNKIVVL